MKGPSVRIMKAYSNFLFLLLYQSAVFVQSWEQEQAEQNAADDGNNGFRKHVTAVIG